MRDDEARGRTLTWLRELVIGRGLCPFARAPFEAGCVRLVVSPAQTLEALLVDLGVELARLAEGDPARLETTLLVHPHCLHDYVEFNDALDLVDALVVERGLEGVLQVVGFHPDYQFADASLDAPENYTNRSPHPMLHLLREASVSRALEEHPDVAAIPIRNVELMRATDPALRERWRRGEGPAHD